jgi:UDP-N-acetylmuramyl pentapeptide phosphotransferase/UDP-N-acetylglucosamine-1-phosphate transferase
MTFPFVGTIYFGDLYYFVIIPLIVTVTTNTVNQLGGLNGLETICPATIMIGLMTISWLMVVAGLSTVPLYSLLYVPLIVWLLLVFFNFRGKIFVGNTGSFAIGITLAAFAIISDSKTGLLISLLPYIFNSSLILLTYFVFRTRAAVSFDGEKLSSGHRRSLITLVTRGRRLTERRLVVIISLLVAASTSVAVLVTLFLM